MSTFLGILLVILTIFVYVAIYKQGTTQTSRRRRNNYNYTNRGYLDRSYDGGDSLDREDFGSSDWNDEDSGSGDSDSSECDSGDSGDGGDCGGADD